MAVSLGKFPGCLALALLAPALVVASPTACFRIFDATGYSDKPDLSGLGVEPAYIFEPDRWWPAGSRHDDLPNPVAIDHWMREIATKKGRMILDVERWPLVGTEASVRESIRRYATIAAWFRAAGYDRPLGYYNVVPIWDRESAIQQKSSTAFRQWRARDAWMRPLLDRLDVLYPSLYTDSGNIDTWIGFANAQIAEARRIASDKLIYIFIWPQFHPSNRELGLQYLPVKMWEAEMQWAREHADGVVIWGGWDFANRKPLRWDGGAAWWTATKRFLKAHPGCGEHDSAQP
jgi:hypothetical protein